MKCYVSSRTQHRAAVSSLYRMIEASGHTVARDWTAFDEGAVVDARHASLLASRILDGIGESDRFVLITDPAGSDIYVELGIALAANAATGKPRIYAVGPHGGRTLMHAHPAIRHVATVADLLEKECPGLLCTEAESVTFS